MVRAGRCSKHRAPRGHDCCSTRAFMKKLLLSNFAHASHGTAQRLLPAFAVFGLFACSLLEGDPADGDDDGGPLGKGGTSAGADCEGLRDCCEAEAFPAASRDSCLAAASFGE